VPFCQLTNIGENVSTSSNYSSTFKAMMTPMPYFINTDGQNFGSSAVSVFHKFWRKVKAIIVTGVSHDVCYWARFQTITTYS